MSSTPEDENRQDCAMVWDAWCLATTLRSSQHRNSLIISLITSKVLCLVMPHGSSPRKQASPRLVLAAEGVQSKPQGTFSGKLQESMESPRRQKNMVILSSNCGMKSRKICSWQHLTVFHCGLASLAQRKPSWKTYRPCPTPKCELQNKMRSLNVILIPIDQGMIQCEVVTIFQYSYIFVWNQTDVNNMSQLDLVAYAISSLVSKWPIS